MLSEWTVDEMKTVDLHDKRLNDRLTSLLSMLGHRPTLSIPTALDGGHNEVTAAYRFFDNSNVGFESILDPHIDATYQRVAEQDTVIVAQDTTEIDLTKPNQKVQGAGPLDDGSRSGEFLHPLIAFTKDGTPLGTLSAEIWTRPPTVPQKKTPTKKKEKQRKHTPIEEKESLRWLETHKHAQEIAEEIPDTRFIAVADSEADIFEVIETTEQSPDNFGWIIRSCQNRGLVLAKGANSVQDEDVQTLLRDHAAQQPVLFTQPITVRGREAKVSCETRGRRQPRESRECEVEVRAATVTIRAPWRHDRKLQNTQVNAVLVSEIDPPKDDVPVEWILITSLPVDTIEEVREVIQSYCIRWMIEVYFRTLKSCKIEDLRFEHIDRFERCLAVHMIIAWRTLFVVRLGREFPELDCEAIFEADEWRSVYVFLNQEPPPESPPPLQEMVRLVARLGGYINRVREDEPGPQTVCQGMQRMHDITRCWRMFGPGARSPDPTETDTPTKALTCV
jgi:hypothetical protein